MKAIHFFEFSEDINVFKNEEDHFFIAMNPSAQARLKDLNLKYISSIDFFNVEGHKSVLDKTNEIFKAINDLYYFKDENDVAVAYNRTFNFHLRLYVNYLLSLTFIIEQSIKTINPNKIYVTKHTNFEEFQVPVSHKDRIIGYLVKKIIKDKNLNIEVVESDSKLNKNKFKLNNLFYKKIITKTANIFYKIFFNKREIILISSPDYNLFEFSKKMQKKIANSTIFITQGALSKKFIKENFFNFIKFKICLFPLIESEKKHMLDFANSKNLKNALASYLEKISLLNDKDEAIVSFLNIDFMEEIKLYIKSSLTKELFALNQQIKLLSNILKIKKPRIILSQSALGINYALGEISKIKKLPAILISHGSHIYHKNDLRAQDEWRAGASILQNTDYPFVASQTPFVQNFLENQKNLQSKIVTTGPIIMKSNGTNLIKTKLKKEFKPDLSKKFVILHASTPKLYSGFRPWIFETVDEYIKNINDIISSIHNRENFFLIIKFRPIPSLTYSQFKKLLILSDNYTIVVSESLQNYLTLCDVLVSYSSTVIEESLNFNTPVILYDPQSKYSHLPSFRVKDKTNIPMKPVYFCDNSNNFLPIIENLEKFGSKITNNNQFFADLKYSEDKNLEWLNQVIC